MIPVLLFAAGLTQATPAGPVYDVSFVLAEATYTGVTTFAVDRKGVVTGTMKIAQPAVVEATLGGTVKDGTWTIDHPYAMPVQGCTGTIKGKAKVPADRKVITGTVTIGGGCAEQPTEATFTFTRQAPKR
ncbi:MAG: hypothetical protein WD690_10050 [Vicinamibacterales bacterium]